MINETLKYQKMIKLKLKRIRKVVMQVCKSTKRWKDVKTSKRLYMKKDHYSQDRKSIKSDRIQHQLMDGRFHKGDFFSKTWLVHMRTLGINRVWKKKSVKIKGENRRAIRTGDKVEEQAGLSRATLEISSRLSYDFPLWKMSHSFYRKIEWLLR